MSASLEVRAGKNVGPLPNANALVGQLNFTKLLPVGSTNITDIAPSAAQKNTYRQLTLAPIGVTGVASSPFMFKGGAAPGQVDQIIYKWNGKPVNILAAALPIPANTYVPILAADLQKLPLAGVIDPTDSVTIVVSGTPVRVFYAATERNSKGFSYARTSLVGTSKVDVLKSKPGLSPVLADINAGLLSVNLGGFFEINYDVAARTISFFLVDDTGAIQETHVQAPLAPGASFNASAYAPLFPTWSLPPGWKIQASLDAAVADQNNPVKIFSQFNFVDEAPVGSGGAGAF